MTLNESQRILWEQWQECWYEVYKRRKKRRLIIEFVGDMIDGLHHETTQLISSNSQEQARIATECILQGLDIAKLNSRKGDKIFMIKGTKCHTKYNEETIARDLTTPKNKPLVTPFQPPKSKHEKDGRFLYEVHKLNVNGVRFNISHEPGAGAGTRVWTKGNAFVSLIKSILIDNAMGGRPHLNYYIRAHKHKFLPRYWEDEYGRRIDGIILPAFQTRTHWATSKFNREDLSTMGMVYVNVDGDGQHELIRHVAPFLEDKYEAV